MQQKHLTDVRGQMFGIGRNVYLTQRPQRSQRANLLTEIKNIAVVMFIIISSRYKLPWRLLINLANGTDL